MTIDKIEKHLKGRRVLEDVGTGEGKSLMVRTVDREGGDEILDQRRARLRHRNPIHALGEARVVLPPSGAEP